MSNHNTLRRDAFLNRGGHCWQVKLLKDGVIHLVNTETGETDRLTVHQWQEECVSGDIVHIARPGAELDEKTAEILQIALPDLPASVLNSVHYKMAYVEAFLDPPAFYEKFMPELPAELRKGTISLSAPKLRPFLAHVARGLGHRHPPGASTFCKWFKTWSEAGMAGSQDPRVLASRYDRRGPQSRFMHPQLEDMLNEVIDTVWLRPGCSRKKAVFKELSKQVSNWNRNHPDDQLEMLSQRHVSRYIAEEVDQRVAMARRRGTKAANLVFKPVGKGPEASTILEIVEVDHTTAHIAVVDDVSGRILGRPTVSVALDRYSRMVLAVHIHFDGSCLAAVMQTLRQVMLPKEFLGDLCPDVAAYQSVFGVPEAYYFDRGTDFDNEHIREIGLALNIRMDFEPVACPQFKGRIERFFRTMHDDVAHPLPGARPSLLNDPDKGLNRTDAKVTFSEFKARTWRWVAGVYANSYHRGIGTTPMARWTQALGSRLPRVPRRKDDIEALLTRVEYCTVSNKGIHWKNLRWNGDALVKIRTRPGFVAKNKVKVRFDEQDLGRAWVIDPVTKTAEPLEPVEPSYMNGRSLFQHRMALLLADEEFEGARDVETLRLCHAMLTEEAEAHFQPDAPGKGKTLRGVARHRKVGANGQDDGLADQRDQQADTKHRQQDQPEQAAAAPETPQALSDEEITRDSQATKPRKTWDVKEVRKNVE